MKCVPPTESEHDLEALQREYGFTPALDELVAALSVWSQPTRLRVFALLDEVGELCVCDLAKVLDTSVSAVSQHLARMRALRLVQYRRDRQTLYYSLSDHPLNPLIRQAIASYREATP